MIGDANEFDLALRKTSTRLALDGRQTRLFRSLRLLTQRAPLWPGGQRVQVDAQLVQPDGKRQQAMRQYLFLNPPFGYVLTVVAPIEQAAARFRDLEDAAADLIPLPPQSDADKADRPAP